MENRIAWNLDRTVLERCCWNVPENTDSYENEYLFAGKREGKRDRKIKRFRFHSLFSIPTGMYTLQKKTFLVDKNRERVYSN